MIYWKEECQGLVNLQSVVLVVDHYDENKVPVFAIRRAQSASGSRSGKNSYWSVSFDEPLSDGCNAVTFPFILATISFDYSIIRKSKFPQNPKRSVRFSGKGTKRSVQKRKARNTQKAETKVL